MTTNTDNSITLNGVTYVPKNSQTQSVGLKGERFAIFRCTQAGVHAGELVSREDGVVKIANSRRLWRWTSVACLSELAVQGPVMVGDNRYGCPIPELDLTESDVCEVIYCTDTARDLIRSVAVWIPK